MRRKRLLVLVSVVLTVQAIAWAALLIIGCADDPGPQDQRLVPKTLARGQLIDRKHFDRIKTGMSRAAVEVILGGPPGNFTTRPMAFSDRLRDPRYDFRYGPVPSEYLCEWSGNQGKISVVFDLNDTVFETSFDPGTPLPQATAPARRQESRGLLRRLWP